MHFLESINRFRNHQDVYIVGTTNVGKSTLINKLIEQSVDEKMSLQHQDFQVQH